MLTAQPFAFENDRVEIKPSNIHGMGLFATRDLRPGDVIGLYEGPVVEETTTDTTDPTASTTTTTNAEVTPADVERVFGRPALAVLPMDRRAPGVQNRGAILPRRGRTGRELDQLARVLLEGVA